MVFAGQALDPPWEGGSLYLCRQCHLAFRQPIRPEQDYERLYERASEHVWVSGGLRVDQRLVLDRIETDRHAGKVLDVGCYDGGLLAALGPQFSKYGIEASAAAAQKARQQGVRILGTRIRDLPSITEKFDVVCAVDVIEHVSSPQDFLGMLAKLLLPNGTLIISTGSADTLAWRSAGGLYWYCSFPEHISFISPAWAGAAAAALGLELVDARRFAYDEIDALSLTKLRRRYHRKVARANLLASIRAWLPGLFSKGGPSRSYGQPGIFEDHILIAMKPIDASSPSLEAA